VVEKPSRRKGKKAKLRNPVEKAKKRSSR